MALKSRRASSSTLRSSDDQVKLTVTHDDFDAGSKVFAKHQRWLAARSCRASRVCLEAGSVLYAPWY